MKFAFSAIAFVASFAFVNAQDLSSIPSCALPCFATAIAATTCSLTDTTCQCTTGKDKITESITACVPTKCSADDITKLTSAVAALCADAGVTVTDLPTAVSTGGSATRTGSVSGSATGSATSAATGAVNSTGAASANGVTFGLAAGIMGFAAWL